MKLNNYEIKDAQYVKDLNTEQNVIVNATIDGKACAVPMDTNNRHYAEIVKRVNEGALTIKDAD
tara:strand:- start:317 stop:508 length:192 start_codon:yes stop_codon:yes gene_type:complete